MQDGGPDLDLLLEISAKREAPLYVKLCFKNNCQPVAWPVALGSDVGLEDRNTKTVL